MKRPQRNTDRGYTLRETLTVATRWFFPPISVLVNGNAPQTPASGSASNAATQSPQQQQLTPHERLCHNMGVLMAGLALGAGVSGAVGLLFPPAAIVTEPVAAALGLNSLEIAFWYAISCQ